MANKRKWECPESTAKKRAKVEVEQTEDENVSRYKRVGRPATDAPGQARKVHKSFFDLPAELRNRVYAYVLHEDVVHVTAALQQPALLRTNRQLRKESKGIWYANNFRVTIQHCDATVHYVFRRHIATIGLKQRFRVGIGLSAPYDWENLVAWCKAMMGGGFSFTAYPTPGRDKDHAFVSIALGIAASHGKRLDHGSDQAWDDCLGALESLRLSAGHFGVEWATS